MKFLMGNGRQYRAKVNKLPLPTKAPDDYTAGAFCIKLSPEWYWIVQGFMELLTIRALWEWTSDQEWLNLSDQLNTLAALPRTCEGEEPEPCPECPECPECGKTGGGCGCSQVGRLGLTLEELESYIMGCLDISDSIRWNPETNMIEVWNCKEGWIAIPGMVSGLLPSAGTPSGEIGLDAWEDGGKPLTPDYPSLPTHENPAYVTDDSVKCAKATALVLMIEDQYDKLNDVLGALTFSNLSVAGIAAIAAQYYATAGTAALIQVGLLLYTGLSSIAGDDLIDQINDMLAMELGSIICALTPNMSAGTTIRDTDIERAFQSYDLIKTPPEVARSVIGALPMSYFKEKAQPQVSSTDCGCGLYLPSGYTPPENTGAINFRELAYSGTTNSNSTFPGVANSPESALPLSPDQGQVINAYSWRTVYTGFDSAGGEPNKYTQLTLILDMPLDTQIDSFLFDMVVNGVPQGAGSVNITVFAAVLDDTNVWRVDNNNNNFALTTATDLDYTLLGLSGHKMAINFKTVNENINLFATISNIRFTGNRAGAGFLNIPMGQPLP